MTKININEQKFKKIAFDLHQAVKQNPNLSYGQILQTLSNSMFSKPYEESKETILKDYSPLNIYSCDGSFFVFNKNKKLIYKSSKREDHDFILKKINKKKITKLEEVTIPFMLEDDDVSSDYVLDIVEKMGYFKHEKTIFDEIETAESIFLNDNHIPYSLNGDWIGELESDPESAIWMPEYNRPSGFYEFFLDFNELCNAEKTGDGCWIITCNDLPLHLKLHF